MADPDPEPEDQEEESTLDKLGDFVRRIVQVPKHEVEDDDPKP
jgi:hypothetical protein